MGANVLNAGILKGQGVSRLQFEDHRWYMQEFANKCYLALKIIGGGGNLSSALVYQFSNLAITLVQLANISNLHNISPSLHIYPICL
jgi:hypothetical protein